MNLFFTVMHGFWVTEFLHNNAILLLCLGVAILLLVLLSINQSKRIKALQQQSEEAKETGLLKNVFIADMTHEMCTPLNVIMGFSNMLAETENLSREERMVFIKEINDNKDCLIQMFNDLLDFSKTETLNYKDEEVDVNVLIDEICVTENSIRHSSDVMVEFIEKLPQCLLRIDRIRFAQVINKLVKNTLNFTKSGSVKVGYRRLSNDTLYFYVTDAGCDIDEARRKEIFDRFMKMNCKTRGICF